MRIARTMLGVLLSATTAAHAQEPGSTETETVETIPVTAAAETPARQPEPEPVQPSRLDEVSVTATKRAANPRDLPASISALRGEDLEQRGYQGQEDFLKLVPGVTFANDNITANRITIRGIGADLNTSNTTGVFIGDVPFEDPTLPRVTLDPNPFDLARIEVLKGPQGTLFGGSALNGAVRYVPEEPELEQWHARTYFQLEEVSQGGVGTNFGGVVNVPVGETLAFRLVGFKRRSAGWVDDEQRELEDINETTQDGGRLLALWQPGEAWKISAMAIVQDTQVADASFTDNREGELSRSNTPQASPMQQSYNLQTLGIQYSFDRFDVLSQTSRTQKRFHAVADASRIGNLTDRPPPSVTITNRNQSRSLMQEFRITSNDGFDPDWKWLGGVFYRQAHMTEVSDILASNIALPIPGAALNLLSGLLPGFITEEGKINTARAVADPVDVTETALFGEVTRTYWDRLDLTVGFRAYQTVSESAVFFSGPLALPQAIDELQTQSVKKGKLTERGISPKVAVKYVFNDHVSLYGSVARGFRFGGAQVLIGTFTSRAPDFYKSDVLWSYELGLRTQWLDRTLTVDLTPFQIDWIDPQLQQADATGLGSFFDNVGGARGRGAELAIRYLTPLPGLAVAFAGSYVDTVTTQPFTTSNGDDTQPGTQWPLAAKWQSASTLAYQRPLSGGWAGGLTAVYATISSAPNTLSYLDTVFGYKTLDLILNLGNAELAGRPELSLNLSNATDVRGKLSGVNNPQFANNFNYIRPRTLIARLTFAF